MQTPSVIPKCHPMNLTNSATDVGAPPQILSFSLAGTPPAGASINPSNGIFNW